MTWTSLGSGIQPDGEEAMATPEFETGEVSTGPTTIDVTRSVQQWVNGDPNYGWAILPLGNDGWDFETSNGATPPKLTISYDPDSAEDGDGEDFDFIDAGDGEDGVFTEYWR